MKFLDVIQDFSWEDIKASIYTKTERDVQQALASTKPNLEDFKALISPAAEGYLEEMAQLSNQLTQQRFGKTMQMYIPMYLSNECQNICTYCGFSLDVPIPRKTLSDEEILAEVKVIKSLGYDHLLLVTGEANKTVGVDYLEHAILLIKPYFSYISIEVQPLQVAEYARLKSAGVDAVLVYQETYHERDYKLHHPKGKKSNYSFRVSTPERIGEAGIYKMGLGILIGLEDWRVDSFYCASHLSFLEKEFWQSKFSLSFPRLRPCSSGLNLKSVMSDKQLVQLICAYRIFNRELELSLSTRESEKFRNHVIKLGITSISADSKTDPGGYSNPNANLEQFEIDDKRHTEDFVKVIESHGYEAVFTDWNHQFM